ncbi:alpha/beta hydrolase [Specibacter cremeus]|uniref:alpha/beta hydrolase n=1 Tax=Specibacter cremeus TaxID=1629051 RepID=UPI001F0C7AFC|nr:alpha/beta hydrolase [Specibacter cremeus]
MAPGIRRLGRALRAVPWSSIANVSPGLLSLIQRIGVPVNPATRFVFGGVAKGVTAQDLTIDGTHRMTVRIYTPVRTTAAARPLVVAYHGGGWVLGGLTMNDWIASRVADGLDAVVVSVGYRLAPAHPFPAAPEDCYAALAWVAAHAPQLGATGRLGVLGDSAGGNLAAVVAIMARDRGGPALAHQALLYPAIDGTGQTPSYKDKERALFLTADDMSRYYQHYLGDHEDRTDWRVSPIHAASLAGLPPAFVAVAGHDLLHDEGVHYARALQGAGVPVHLARYPAMTHGFLSFPRFARDAGPAIEHLIDAQREALA